MFDLGPGELGLALALAALLVALAATSYRTTESEQRAPRHTLARFWIWLTEPRHGVAPSITSGIAMSVVFVLLVMQDASVAPVLWPVLVFSDAVALTRFRRGRALGRQPVR